MSNDTKTELVSDPCGDRVGDLQARLREAQAAMADMRSVTADARRAGRVEAFKALLNLGAGNVGDLIASVQCGASGEFDEAWDDDKLRELLDIDGNEPAASVIDRADELYWSVAWGQDELQREVALLKVMNKEAGLATLAEPTRADAERWGDEVGISAVYRKGDDIEGDACELLRRFAIVARGVLPAAATAAQPKPTPEQIDKICSAVAWGAIWPRDFDADAQRVMREKVRSGLRAAQIGAAATAAQPDPVDSFLAEQLRMWKDEGVPAPLNELQSIHAWLGHLAEHGADKTLEMMRTRMVLLMDAAAALNTAGPEAENKAGIYDNRPDMRPNSQAAATAAQQHPSDAERLEWLLHRLSGSELRRIGVVTSSGGLRWGRDAIDAAMGGPQGASQAGGAGE